MIRRFHTGVGGLSEAVYSDCLTYRYILRRRWAEGQEILFILLNPSTATEERNDPTVERCMRRAAALGFASFSVANLFALRSTDPQGLYRAADPVGSDNDRLIAEAADAAAMALCGWGTHGAHLDRAAAVRGLLRRVDIDPWHLGLTRMGQPRHPLYIGYAVKPQPWVEK